MSLVLPPGQLPECWGHRGASSTFPENTIASFEAAIRDGAHGVESDVHVSRDGVVVMFHDPDLSRTTDSTGLIKERDWYGEDGISKVRTVKEPKQAIPTFTETVALLMLPENRHVKFNVDVKVENDPNQLFKLMHETISAQQDWETILAPRILVGLWHTKFILPAKTHLPYLSLSYIGLDLEAAREYFWESCDVFSIFFNVLTTVEGERFRKDAAAAKKKIMVWTVNEPLQMMEAARWSISVILTDKPQVWLDLRKKLEENPATSLQYGRTFLWTSPFYYRPTHLIYGYMVRKHLEKAAGPFENVVLPQTQALSANTVPPIIAVSVAP